MACLLAVKHSILIVSGLNNGLRCQYDACSEGLTFENHIRCRGCGNEGWATLADIVTEAWRI